VKKDTKSYKLPLNYFEDFQDRLNVQIELEELLSDTKNGGFVVPEGYFDSLTQKLLKIPNEKKVMPLKAQSWYWPSVGIAAAVLLFIALYTGNNEASLEALEIEDIASYLDVESANLYAEDIASLLTDEEISTVILGETSPEEEELINYLDIYSNSYDLLIE
jgi:hypothetical protein